MFWRLWRSSARLALRDLAGSRTRAMFIACAMAISIASVTGLTGAAETARQLLGRNSRIWLAGDLAADTTEPIAEGQIAALNARRAGGIEWTMVTWVLTSASSTAAPDPVLLAAKAVDPAIYPFYGETTLSPPGRLAQALRPDTVVVSNRVAENLHVGIGSLIRIGGKPFTVTALIAAEPERSNGMLGWGPRCILSREGFERLAANGSSRTNRILLRLPSAADMHAERRWLQALVPEGRVFDYREAAAPEVARMELVISFAGITAFLGFALGAVGVATAARLNLEQRIETLARLRILGARTWQMAAVFLVETAAMLIAGLAIGIPLGWAMRSAILSFAGNYLVLPHASGWDAATILETAVSAAIILAPILAGPVASLRRLRPLAVLRGDHAGAKSELSISTPLALLACAAAAGIAHRLIQDWKPALVLASSVALSVALAAALGVAFLGLVRRSLAAFRRMPAWKHALIGLCRASGQTMTPVVCVALGVMVIAGTFQSADAVARTVTAALPYPRTNLLVVDFEESQGPEVRQFLEQQPGVENIETLTQAWLRVASMDGRPVEDARYLVRCASAPAGGVSIAADLASHLGVRKGSALEFETHSGTLRARVTAVHHPSPEERFWYTFVLDCQGLPRSSLAEVAAVRIRADSVEAVQRALNARYPTLASITAGELRSTIDAVTADALAMLRLLNWMAAAGGLMILVAVVAASRSVRSREIAIFSALGASRRAIVKIYSLEFAVLGAVSGAIGASLGIALNGLVLTLLFHRPQMPVSWTSIAGSVLLTPVLTLAAAWLPLVRLLGRKPFVLLREDCL